MDFGRTLQEMRGRMSRERAGREILVSPRTIEAWETRGIDPGPEAVVRMARVYGRPDLRPLYCRKECPIGQTYHYEFLNNINDDLMTVLVRLLKEHTEAGIAINQLMQLAVNKNGREDFSDAELADFEKAYQELLDVDHAIEVLKRVLDQRVLDLDEQVRKHNDKCFRNGYVVNGGPTAGKKKEHALAGAL